MHAVRHTSHLQYRLLSALNTNDCSWQRVNVQLSAFPIVYFLRPIRDVDSYRLIDKEGLGAKLSGQTWPLSITKMVEFRQNLSS
jgi:hypothetical protein